MGGGSPVTGEEGKELHRERPVFFCAEVKGSPADGEISAMNDSDDIVKEFLVESYENLDRLDRDLITLEKNPSDREVLGSIFRTIHTIKGTSGFLAFDKLGAVAHVGENLLGQLRDGALLLNREITTARGYYRECTAIPHVPPPSPLIHTSSVTVETTIPNRLRNSM